MSQQTATPAKPDGLTVGTAATTPPASGVQSVDRALSILQVLGLHGGLGVTEIAREAGVHKSTAFRQLSTLEARGFVEQQGDRGLYRLGYAAAQLAAGATGSHDLTAAGHQVCVDLAAAVGETVALVVSDGREVTTVDQVVGESKLSSSDGVGRRSPLHATAAGKVFLAAMPAAELDRALGPRLARFTPHTVCDRDRLRAQLDDVRTHDVATVAEEHEIGLVAVAAPVRGSGGGLVAAMTIAGPGYRVNAATLPGLTARLRDAAAEVSWRLGHLKRG